MPDLLPTTFIGNTEITRLACGSNPFLGYSYRSAAHDAWQRRTMTPERIALVLERSLECGINVMLGNFDDDYILHQARQICERRVGSAPHWVAYTHGGPERQIETIDRLVDQGAFAIYIQGGVVDSCFKYNYVGGICIDGTDNLNDIVPWLEHIKAKGCVAGMGTHRPQIIAEAENRNIGAEFYVTPLNYLGIYCEYANAVRIINQTDKPFIAIKTLGGGAKTSPEEGLTCAYTALKKSDIVAVGCENEEIAEYNAALVRNLLGWLNGKVM